MELGSSSTIQCLVTTCSTSGVVSSDSGANESAYVVASMMVVIWV